MEKGLPGQLVEEATEAGDDITTTQTAHTQTPVRTVESVRFGEISSVSLSAARLGMLSKGSDAIVPEDLTEGRMNWFSSTGRRSSRTVIDQHQRNVAVTIVTSLPFRVVVIFAIVFNAAYIGFVSDQQVKNSFRKLHGEKLSDISKIPDITFTVWFIIEISLRLAAEQKMFFTGDEVVWNVFDVVLILNSLSELIAPQLFSDFSFLRILRVFRLVRVIRVVKAVKALRSLRTMVFALLNSFTALLWAFVMIGLVIFMFSILFCNSVAHHYDLLLVESLEHEAQALQVTAAEEAFGSLYRSGTSLFSAITGGADWMEYGHILKQLRQDDSDLSGELYFVIFGFYVGFCAVGMLNVVTGIFVDSAVTTRTEDEVVDAFTDEMKRRCQEVRRIFHEADADEQGSLTFNQFKEHLENPWVKAYFSGLEIDPGEAAIIFTLMDTNCNGRVSVDEFIDGTMKLKGSAKSVDLLGLMFDNARFALKFNSLCSFVEEEFRFIKGVMAPGQVSDVRIFKSANGMTADVSELKPKESEVEPRESVSLLS
eukprot:TRINITY_DN47641_c0_g1_i1.p1 TRINITY_DN47641_c0_g1~~TRINITY_DN47641_c0_g1_i1.p1  ORF type:complete len:630 (+),score=105.82 TRINITY_DN47641_c0_g1_i1:275-1891(+)